MKRVLLFALIMLLSISILGCLEESTDNRVNEQLQQVGGTDQAAKSEDTDIQAVASVVENFGKQLQMVSLLAPTDILAASMQEYYSEYVSQALINEWIQDPLNAPGRLTSSPWPDRIEIDSIEKISETAYEVKGNIIEITSVEQESGGVAAKRPITLTVKLIDNCWLIDAVTLGEDEDASSIVYENNEYGFKFSLPMSWEGFKVVIDEWEGISLDNQQNSKTVEAGSIINLRHPEWTSENPRQDIPIMVFTVQQWESLQQQKFHIGAAPIGPSELGRNSEYVFALPARYNYSFPIGYEEVEDIIATNPLQPILEN